MQQLARLYVSQFGTDTAWYDHHLFELTDPESGRPTDTIFHLENAGGKTSLLSFIFSCFDPRKERWLQFLQKKTHRLEDYFSRDGRLAFLIMEWSIPDQGKRTERLILGQVVSLRSNTERGMETERCFFAFSAGQGVELEDIPAPGLACGPGCAVEPARTMQEFLRWMQQAAAKAGDLFHTKVQNDWLTHLDSVRRLDMDLLRMQVDFNSNEGGMEEGFLTFTSEWDLLRRFLGLTLDAEKSRAVRDGVAQTVDRQRLRPVYLNREAQLIRLDEAMTPFADKAALYEASLAEQLQLRRQAGGLSLALLRRRDLYREDAAELRAEAENQRQRAGTAEAAAREQEHAARALHLLRLERSVKEAQCRQQEALRRHEESARRLRCMQAAKARGETEAALERVRRLEREQENALQGLQPFREEAGRQGARFCAGLLRAEKLCREREEQAKAEQKQARSDIAEAQAKKRKLLEANSKMDREQGQLQYFMDSHQRQRQRLIADGILKDDDVAHALNGWREAISEDTFRQDALARAGEDLEEQESALRAQAAEAAEQAVASRAEQAPLREYLAKGGALREDLTQHAALRTAADADEADPDSPALMPALERLLESTRDEIIRGEIRRSRLEEDKASIDETGLAGRNADTDFVVRQLKEAGISSARAVNTYVADLCPEAPEARALVLSDPARFLGINVARAEWEKTCAAAASLRHDISLPVTVSIADLTPSSPGTERLVLAPRDDAAYNKAAARQALDALGERISAVKRRLTEHERRRKEAEHTRVRLLDYQTTYGAEKMGRAERALAQHLAEEKNARERQQSCLMQAEAAKKQRQDCERQIGTLRTRLAALRHTVTRLEEFQRDWDQPLAGVRTRLEEVCRQQRANRALLEELEQQCADAETRDRTAGEKAYQSGAEALTLAKERAGVAFGTATPEDEDAIAGQPLESLRQAYEDARALLGTEEQHRLGVVAERLNSAREAHQKARLEYRDAYGDLPDREVAPFSSVPELDRSIQEQAILVRDMRMEQGAADRELLEKRTTLKNYTDNLPRPPAITPAMHAMDDAAVKTAEEEALRETGRYTSEKEQAELAARNAADAAVRTDANAALAHSQYEMLRAAIPGEVPETPPPLPDNAGTLVSELIERDRRQREAVDMSFKAAERAFRAVVQTVSDPAFRDAEPELSRDIGSNSFENSCSDRARLTGLIHDRLCSVRDTLASMEPDFEKCVEELYDLTNESIRLLIRACGIAMPDATPFVGGKHILKMRPFPNIGKDDRRERVRQQLSALISEERVPERGADLAARCLMAVSGRQELGLQVLTMEQNTEHQYQPASALKGSRGQGAMLAMFLYLIISQLRNETKAKITRGGGPLILDNPFAKVQSRPLIAAQQLLARQIGVQLIFFTASADTNILAGFRRVIRLRKAGVNSKTGRSHIESISAVFTDLTPESRPEEPRT